MPDWVKLLKTDVGRFNSERQAGRASGQHPDLTGADLRGVDLGKAEIGRCNLTRANLAGATVNPELIATCRLEGTVLDDVRSGDKSGLDRMRLVRMLWGDVAGFNRARDRQPDLALADLSGADLRDANLEKAILNGANLAGKIGRASCRERRQDAVLAG